MNTAAEAKAVGYDDVRGLVRGILLISLAIEALTFCFLAPRFAFGYDYSPGDAAWHALYHSVSSFNNQGFALYTDNMIGFATDPWNCLPMCAAIILGGLGFPVIMQSRRVPPAAALEHEHEDRALGDSAAAGRRNGVHRGVRVDEFRHVGRVRSGVAHPHRVLPIGADPHGRVPIGSTSG